MRQRVPDKDKLVNTAAVAPAMPGTRRRAKIIVKEKIITLPPEVPQLAAKIILFNCGFWLVAFLLLAGGKFPPGQLLLGLLGLAVAIVAGLGLLWLISRAFWWFVVLCSVTVSLAIVAYIVSEILRATSSVQRV